MRLSRGNLKRNWARLAVAVGASALSIGSLTGCGEGAPNLNPLDIKSWIDPSELAGRVRKDTIYVQILDKVDPQVEEPNRDFLTAQPPTQDDLTVTATDYVISKNDLLSVEISDLSGPGTQTVKTARVSESGNISLPFVGQIKAEGLTEFELEQAIIKTYHDAKILEKAQISVTVGEARGRVISLLGAFNQPGQYALIDPDFRVLDAITLARDTTTPLLTDLYIIRRTDLSRPSNKGSMSPDMPATLPTQGKPGVGADDLKPQSSTNDLLPARVAMVRQHAPRAATVKAQLLAPLGPSQRGERPLMLADTATLPSVDSGVDSVGHYTMVGGKKVYIDNNPAAPATPGVPAPAPTPAPGSDSLAPMPAPAAVTPPVAAAPTPAPAAAATAPSASSFAGFRDLTAPDNTRIIHIPLDRLRAGDLQYNVVIKPRDMIIAQPLPIGEYYMGGHVAQPGAYSLSQRRISLKQAVTAARMLDQLAIPERTDIVRRIGPNKEVFVRVNLAKIFDGEAPDIYLKPDDQVYVGTNFIAPFIAAIRGAFRFTYGFGFLYDRNFAAEENNRVGG